MTFATDLHTPRSRSAISQPIVIVAEGRDTFGFVLAFLRNLGLDQKIELRNGGGIPDLYDYLAVLPNISGFGLVTSLGVVCDCEDDPQLSFARLCDALKRATLPVPAAVWQPTASPPTPRVALALLPDGVSPGMLETLLWQSLSGDPRLPCVEEYLDCVRRQTGQQLSHEGKSRIYSYVGGREQPWLLIGQAAHAGYFPWTSPAFDQLKAFVSGLISP